MAKLFANSGDPDQMLHSALSDLSLHCLPINLSGVSRAKWIKNHLWQNHGSLPFQPQHPVVNRNILSGYLVVLKGIANRADKKQSELAELDLFFPSVKYQK